MTDEHKAALAQGRRESKAIKGYLLAISVPKRRGRPVTPETLEAKIEALEAAGVVMAETPTDMGTAMMEAMNK
jgi:succinyl-CoA synthetase alpha subunit